MCASTAGRNQDPISSSSDFASEAVASVTVRANSRAPWPSLAGRPTQVSWICPTRTDWGDFEWMAWAIAEVTSGIRAMAVAMAADDAPVSGMRGEPRSSTICSRSTLSRRWKAASHSQERWRTTVTKSEVWGDTTAAPMSGVYKRASGSPARPYYRNRLLPFAASSLGAHCDEKQQIGRLKDFSIGLSVHIIALISGRSVD